MEEERKIMTVDIGNTAMKVGVYCGERPVQSVVSVGNRVETIRTMLTFHSVDGIAVCCVGSDPDRIADQLRQEDVVPVVELTSETDVPILVEYGSRATLGVDRLAAAVGVMEEDRAILMIDAGTAMTADLVVGRRFVGGNISPGLRLRFRSLNAFTRRLPLVSPDGELPEFGYDTETAIRSGVVNGLLGEIELYYREALSRYKELEMVLAGGDAQLLGPLLEKRGIPVRIDTEVVGRGLVRIYNYNNKI